ncbi:MAG: thioredoxin domain-containing protein [Chloroflexota bacterium]|nr:thioredoxin domain-containing protein [Chloroflexota bacterium]
MANRLSGETSPYLLQHAHNPVDWYPWGEEALARARAEDRPILLSIGYSACHWCHVMERESFENADIARLMNDTFVNIKVDREERPDLDNIYMEAVQAMTGQGGWPMTVFLTPDGAPFYGGTYFPPADRMGMPGFPRVLRSVADAYRRSPDEAHNFAKELRGSLGRSLMGYEERALTPEVTAHAYRGLADAFDPTYGGFGGAPKFPQPMNFEFLLRHHHRAGEPHALEMTRVTLDHMAHGGIYDQLGGGFHRYATDAIWLVPHFEKMLYDNALLARVYLEAYQVTGAEEYRRVVEETLDYVTREMTSPEGGFYAAQDADSEGVEGKYFVWTRGEIAAVVGTDDAPLVCAYYGVTERGNFEGENILHRMIPLADAARNAGVAPHRMQAAVERARPLLLAARERRVKPGRDDKILTAWNGLTLRAFADAARVLGRDDYRAVAERSADFLLTNLKTGDGRLLRTYKDGRAKIDGYLDDYAALADGLLALYACTFEPRLFAEARALADAILARFWDEREGGFYMTSDDGHTELISRPKEVFDNAVPSGNSTAVDVLLRLAALSGENSYAERAERTLQGLTGIVQRAPSGFGRSLAAMEFALSTPTEVAIAGDLEGAADALLQVVNGAYRPNVVTAVMRPGALEAGIALLEGRDRVDGQAAAYVCERFACRRPVTTPDDLARELG